MLFQHFDAKLTPPPCREQAGEGVFTFPQTVQVQVADASLRDSLAVTTLLSDLTWLLNRPVELSASAPIRLELDGSQQNEGSYHLNVTPEHITLRAGSPLGLLYAVYSLSQLVGLRRLEGHADTLPAQTIDDRPHFVHRSLMLDLGRAPFSLPLLKRIVRIASRLKLNTLHLHLHDNELNAVRYPGTTLGAENPYALPLSDYAELLRYAQPYGVELIPELESWGHCGSLLRHRPELYGASRPHGRGHALGIGPAMLDFLDELYDAWLSILPDGSKLHVGLDEANWRLLPGADPAVFRPENLVRLVYDRLMARAAAQRKRITMMMWWDPEQGLAIPPDLHERMIVEPWWYVTHKYKVEDLLAPHRAEQAEVRPFVCGMGMSSLHEAGATLTTFRWMELAQHIPNCLGGNICVWGVNNLAERMVGLFVGAALLWSPAGFASRCPRAQRSEEDHGRLTMLARIWQSITPDAYPDALRADTGPAVHMGYYQFGDHAGQPPAPKWSPAQPILGGGSGE